MEQLELKKFGQLLLIKKNNGSTPVGFHTTNMQIADLSNEAWEAVTGEPRFEDEAYQSLKDWNSEVDPAASADLSTKGIKALTINVTQICNLHCTYCAAGGNGTYGDPMKRISIEKTIPQLKFFLDRAEMNSNFSINFLGGEPLLYPESVQMLGEYVRERALEKNLDLSLWVTTNGTLFNSQNLEILSKLQANITISIDGPKDITDKARPSNNGQSTSEAFEAGMALLSHYREQLGKIRLHAVFGAHNLEVQKVYDYFAGFDIDQMTFGYDANESRPEIGLEFAQKLTQTAQKAYLDGGVKALRKIDFFDNVFYRLDNQKRLQNYCGAGKSFLMVDAKNNLFTCPWDVNEKEEMIGFDTTVSEKKLTSYQNPLTDNTSCQSCWAKNLCGGGCMRTHKVATGNKHSVSESFCLRTKYLISQAILLYEQERR